MANHATKAARHSAGWWVLQIILGIVQRLWAFALIVLVLYLSWNALMYLVNALVLPAGPPAQITAVPLRPNEALLRAAPGELAGVTAVANPRTPPTHYHQIDAWFQPDPQNTCTQSGCHAPLPHGRNKADRAFLNMHATSLHCGVCHLQTDVRPLPLTWYHLKTGAAQDTPALLRAYAWLQDPPHQARPATRTDQAEVVALIKAAATEAGGSVKLRELARHLAAVRPASEMFQRLLASARDILPEHFRGEYGAKLALQDPQTHAPRLAHPGSTDAVRRYLAEKGTLTGADRATVLQQVHPLRRPQTLHCTECHRSEGALVDLAALGYPPARVQQLTQPMLMQAIESMASGRPFFMPGFFGNGALPTHPGPATTTQPADGQP